MGPVTSSPKGIAMIGSFDRIISAISAFLKYFAAALLILVSLLIALDVALRGIFNAPIIGVAEVVANGIVIIAFLQLTYTVRIGAMLRSELLLGLLPPKARRILEAIVSALGALFFGLLAHASVDPMMRAISRGEFEGHATFQVPTWPVKSIIVVCSVLTVVSYLLLTWRALSGQSLPGEQDGAPDLEGAH